ncbi:MAG TPA: hypothetical protein VFW00_03435 [Rhodocyclaceae bacterium]|nr:hypothetical protein [Rhodocyclaceae bacterium]
MQIQTPAIIDVEASGFGAGSYPIEIGFVLPDGQCFCSLIRPAPEWKHWNAQAARIHGIPRELLFERGKPVGEVAAILNDKLLGLTVYSDGWAHDYTWLSVLFDEAKRIPSFRLEHLARILGENEANRWNIVRKQVEQDLCLSRHRASNDAKVLQTTWRRIHDPLNLAAA